MLIQAEWMTACYKGWKGRIRIMLLLWDSYSDSEMVQEQLGAGKTQDMTLCLCLFP